MEMPVPNAGVMARRDQIVARLDGVLGRDSVIWTPEEVRAYECDALTAYRCPPLAVCLPRTTEEVAATVRICAEEGVPIVPRGAGTSLAGGSLPTADSVLLGVARMNRVLDADYANRVVHVQTGITNLAVTGAVQGDGFFYAPDPSSQLACAISGNIAMNSGGAHCLKYGVTTNNLLGVRMVMADGEIVQIGGPWLDAPGYDLLGLICGSEGQLGIVTEAWLRILAKPEGARPVLMGFDSSETAGACVADIIRSGVIPVAIEFMDRPCIHATEAHAGAGYPLDVEALLIVEVEGSEAEIDEQLAAIKQVAGRHSPTGAARGAVRSRGGRDLAGPQVRLRRDGAAWRLHLFGRHRADFDAPAGASPHGRAGGRLWPPRRERFPRGGRQPASAYHLRRQRARPAWEGRGTRGGHP